MGIAVMGGFTTSTLLTLVVVPVLFTYVDNLQYWIVKLLSGGNKRRQVAVAGASGEDSNGIVTRND
jgi:hypothetical protein